MRNTNCAWRCPSCQNITQRRRGDETPVRKHYEQSPTSAAIVNMSICDDPSQQDKSIVDESPQHVINAGDSENTGMNKIMESFSSLLDLKLANVRQDLVSLDSKLSSAKEQISKEIKNEFNKAIDQIKLEFSATTDFLSDQIMGFKSDLCAMDERVKHLELENSRLNSELMIVKKRQNSQSDVLILEDRIEQMHTELNDRDQMLLLNEVEITGVPEYPEESTGHIIQSFALKLGMIVEDRDIVSVDRAGPIRRAAGEGDAKPRPRPLVVRLARRALRDELLRNARVRRGLNTSDIGLPKHNPLPIYVNERLTKTNRKLFWQARQAGSSANWKYVWTKGGRIYAKRTDGGNRAVQIRSEKDIQNIFGINPVESRNS